jgi:hypothetical protein
VHDRGDSYERKEPIYQATRCHIPEDRNFDIHRSDDLKPPQPIAPSKFSVLFKEFQKNLKVAAEVTLHKLVWLMNVKELLEWMNGNKKVKQTCA